ncbi:MAG: restriction endonuclease subunit S [Nannocystaceae bacterium]|nr:restriction endonuclease subunit S [bacterium]
MAETWTDARLGDGISLVSGQHIDAADYGDDPSGVPYITGPADFPDGRVVVTKYTHVPKTRCSAGDILLTVKGSGTGKLAMADDDYCISRQLMAVRPKEWDSAFVFYTLERLTDEMRRAAVGFIPGIKRSDVLDATLPLPPLPEQRKIAAILSSVDEAIEATQAVIDQVQVVKKGLMQELLTNGLPGRHKKFKQTEIGQIPEEWEVVEGAELFKLYGGYGPSSIVFADGEEGDSLFIKVNAFNMPENRRWIRVGEQSFDSAANSKIRTYADGHLVFPKRGAAIFKNRVRLLLRATAVDPNLMVLAPLADLNPQFFRYLLLWIGLFNLSDNSGIPQLNNKHLYPRKFPIPGRVEQDAIADVLARTDDRLETEAQGLVRLSQLKSALMSVLLTGELRVRTEATGGD